MKKFMVVYVIDGDTSAYFTDDYSKAKNHQMDVECGMGGYSEIYVRNEEEYTFLES